MTIKDNDIFSVFDENKPTAINTSMDNLPKEGERNKYFSTTALSLANKGKSELEIYEQLETEAIKTGYPIKELKAVIKSAFNKKRNQNIIKLENQKDNDLYNANLLKKIIYEDEKDIISVNESFYVFDQGFWQKDDNNYPLKKAAEVNKLILNEITDDYENNRYLDKHYQKSKNISHQNNMVSQLLPLVSKSNKDIDSTDTYKLVNFKNGVLNVDTLNFSDHDSKNYITMQVPYDYDENAQCPKWHYFLDRITTKKPIKEDIQKLFGQCLISETFEHFIIFMGNGANGKTITTQILQEMMGNYATQVENEVISGDTNKPAAKFSNHIMKSKRVCITSETDKGCVLSGSFVKAYTSHIEFPSEEKHKPKEFWYPTGHFIVETNHEPIIKEQTKAIRRRVKIFPFMDEIPENEQIEQNKLINDLKTELPGIFNWALEGYIKNQKEGLNFSKYITEATDDYIDDQNPIFHFMNQSTIKTNFTDSVKLNKLWKIYNEYIENEGEDGVKTNKQFAKILVEMGYQKEKLTDGAYIYGFKLNEDSEYVKIRDIVFG